MKILWLIIFAALVVGCSSPKHIVMEKNKNFVVEYEGVPLFSFRAPDGTWYFSPGGFERMKRGFTHITGVPPNSFVGYAINFSMESIEGRQGSLKEVVPAFKTQNFNPFLQRHMAKFTPARLAETKWKNVGGKLIKFQGYTCKNVWFEWVLAPHLNDGKV